MNEGRFQITPSLIASALLHGGVAIGILLFWPKTPPTSMSFGMTVPVNIVANGPVADIRPAVAAPDPLEALTEDPVPDAAIEPVAPTPDPVPQPAPAAVAQNKPTPTPPKPAPGKAKPQPDFFASLEASLAANKKAAGAQKSGGQRGPNRPEQAVESRPKVGAGRAMTATEMADLAGPLMRLWNVDTLCRVEGASGVDLLIEATIGSNGYLVEKPVVLKGETDEFARAAAVNAKAAFRRAEPFKLPAGFQEQKIKFRFNARDACANRR